MRTLITAKPAGITAASFFFAFLAALLCAACEGPSGVHIKATPEITLPLGSILDTKDMSVVKEFLDAAAIAEHVGNDAEVWYYSKADIKVNEAGDMVDGVEVEGDPNPSAQTFIVHYKPEGLSGILPEPLPNAPVPYPLNVGDFAIPIIPLPKLGNMMEVLKGLKLKYAYLYVYVNGTGIAGKMTLSIGSDTVINAREFSDPYLNVSFPIVTYNPDSPIYTEDFNAKNYSAVYDLAGVINSGSSAAGFSVTINDLILNGPANLAIDFGIVLPMSFTNEGDPVTIDGTLYRKLEIGAFEDMRGSVNQELNKMGVGVLKRLDIKIYNIQNDLLGGIALGVADDESGTSWENHNAIPFEDESPGGTISFPGGLTSLPEIVLLTGYDFTIKPTTDPSEGKFDFYATVHATLDVDYTRKF